MITIQPPRQRPQDRKQTETDKTPSRQVASFPAPLRGLVTNQNFGAQGLDTACVLDNFWPTATAIQPRGGYKERVDVAGDVSGLFNYAAGDEFIVTDDSRIYTFNANTADGTTLSAVVTGLSGSDWQGTETQNDAGSFYTLVNGEDNLRLYDGTTFNEVTTVSSPYAITGSGFSATSDLSYVWNYRERQWFIQKDSMNAWYLGVNSIAGTITKFPMAGVFNKGGTLHSGTTFSSDSGDGLDDRIVFLTTNGEFALYSGDPSGTMSLIGVYEIGEPIARQPFIKIAGDVLVVTKSGLIPVSAAVQKDPSQLKIASVSRNIEPDWEYWQSAQPSGWKVAKWSGRNMAIVSVPVVERPLVYVVNLETGAWARWTGINMEHVAILGDRLYFSTGTQVYEGDTTGQDNETNFICKMCGAFQTFQSPIYKVAKRVRGNFRADISFLPKFSVATDYDTEFPTAPNSATVEELDGAVWDASEWDEAYWAGYENTKTGVSQWHVVNGGGFALAVQLQITSGDTAKLDCELVGYDLTYVPGDV